MRREGRPFGIQSYDFSPTSEKYCIVGLLLQIACANVANLLPARANSRQKEVALRLALGAARRDVIRLVVGEGFKLTIFGVALGIAGAMALTRFVWSLLFGVKTTDRLTFVAVPPLLTLVALLSSYLPARRATEIDPLVALRYE